MTKAVVSGGAGYVGRFITENLLSDDIDVTITGRTEPPDGFFSAPVTFIKAPLDPEFDYGEIFKGADYFIHAGFDHIAGRYRGGEGDDREGFAHKNLGGSMAMFKAAKRAGVRRAVFLSSRAAYGVMPAGQDLYESEAASPDTLYGKVKLETETMLNTMAGPDFTPVSLRMTGVYGPGGPGRGHKWEALFDLYAKGVETTPRASTEVHGEDAARAVRLALEAPPEKLAGSLFNVSDIIVDNADILAPLKAYLGSAHPLPERASRADINAMNCDRLKNLGWRAAGPTKLNFTLEKLIRDWAAARPG